jgi:microsomal dipeptidase-like Zn-dependent dipeptidase
MVCLALLALAAVPSIAHAAETRYSLAGGCYSLRSNGTGKYVAHQADGRFAATARVPGAAEPFRMKATALGRYLLYGKGRVFLAKGGDGIVAVRRPGAAANWRVDDAGPARFSMDLPKAGKVLASSTGGALRLKARSADAADDFSFESAGSCARFPEADGAARGSPFRGSTAQGEVKGTLDAHAHITAFEFIGGNFHCGRPWSPYGIAVALPDCASIQGPQGSKAPVQNFVDYGEPVHPHDTVGYPTFRDWPSYKGLSYEGTYWKWVERGWKAGLRVMVTQLVENKALCQLMDNQRNPCDEMASSRIQRNDLYALQDYIDAQYGGPGKGFLRVVTDPFEARRVVNRGKLAVVMGMETSALFGCREQNGVSECDQAKVDRGLNEFRRLGVRSFFPVHKFDNAFGGTKMDGGNVGPVINGGNKLEAGHYWDVKTCDGPEADNEQPTSGDPGLAATLAGTPLGPLVPPGAQPVYPPPPHCNTRRLTPLGHYLLRRLISQHLIVEIDHMDAISRNQTLDLLESKGYSGVISAHSWASPLNHPRIYRLGGLVTPSAHDAPGFVGDWKAFRKLSDRHYYFGFGFGSDMNGLAEQGKPHPIHYPFKSLDGKVTFNRQVTGQRTFDYTKDGVAQYGMYAEWLENLRLMAGPQISKEMNRGAEAYLEMWERANGIPRTSCRKRRAAFTRRGLGRVRLGKTAVQVLRRAGQPSSRPGSLYRWCVKRSRGAVTAAFDKRGRVALVASSARRHRSGKVHPGTRARILKGRAKRRKSGLWIGRRVRRGARRVYLVRKRRVRVVAIAKRSLVRRPGALRRLLRAARRTRGISTLTPTGFAVKSATFTQVAATSTGPRHALCTF